jgi:hypothetical protein
MSPLTNFRSIKNGKVLTLAVLAFSLCILHAAEPEKKDHERLVWKSDEDIAREQRAKKEAAARALESTKDLKVEVIDLSAPKPKPKPIEKSVEPPAEKLVKKPIEPPPDDAIQFAGTQTEQTKQIIDLYLQWSKINGNIALSCDAKSSCDGKKIIIAGFEVPSLPSENAEEFLKARMIWKIQMGFDVCLDPIEQKFLAPLNALTDASLISEIESAIRKENAKLNNTIMFKTMKNSKARELDQNLQRLAATTDKDKYTVLYKETVQQAVVYIKARDEYVSRRIQQETYKALLKHISDKLDSLK